MRNEGKVISGGDAARDTFNAPNEFKAFRFSKSSGRGTSLIVEKFRVGIVFDTWTVRSLGKYRSSLSRKTSGACKVSLEK